MISPAGGNGPAGAGMPRRPPSEGCLWAFIKLGDRPPTSPPRHQHRRPATRDVPHSPGASRCLRCGRGLAACGGGRPALSCPRSVRTTPPNRARRLRRDVADYPRHFRGAAAYHAGDDRHVGCARDHRRALCRASGACALTCSGPGAGGVHLCSLGAATLPPAGGLIDVSCPVLPTLESR